MCDYFCRYNVFLKFMQMRTVTLVKPIMGIVMVLLAIALFGCQNQVEEPLFTESNQMADMPFNLWRTSFSSRCRFIVCK